MTRKLVPGSRLVVASHNKGKVREMIELVAPYGIEVKLASELGLDEPAETETTFEGNARLKAVAAATASGLVAFADDSGLEVEALGGAPGIFSARWAGPTRDFTVAMRRVEVELAARSAMAPEARRANFISVLSLAWPDGQTTTFEGKVFGHLVWPPRGTNGFGYDPMFLPDGETETFGEMEPSRKQPLTHRARAFEKLKEACLGS